jgi:hypothetical protein
MLHLPPLVEKEHVMASVAVRIDETLYSLAKAEAKRQHRSITKQIELWLMTGGMPKTAEDESNKYQTIRNQLAQFTPSVDEFLSNRQKAWLSLSIPNITIHSIR